ncbi:MAG: hypothetical protein H6681_00340 [Desulfobacteraceae bacterium]|nr:hypothetical protein [Desulfobacteraceae bacterium]
MPSTVLSLIDTGYYEEVAAGIMVKDTNNNLLWLNKRLRNLFRLRKWNLSDGLREE